MHRPTTHAFTRTKRDSQPTPVSVTIQWEHLTNGYPSAISIVGICRAAKFFSSSSGL